MESEYVLGIQVLFFGGITAGYHSLRMDGTIIHRYLLLLARYTTCLLGSQFLELICLTVYTICQTRQLDLRWRPKYRNTVCAFVVSAALLYYNDQLVLDLESVLLLIACSIARYVEMKRRAATITYGEGMACGFCEGYLYQVIPNDGAKFFGLEEHIRNVEAGQRAVFPVRMLFIVVTKSLYCPPNLEEFNKNDDSLPKLEACRSLPDVKKDVAGVKDRIYRNTTYKIRRGPLDPRPVHVVAECATPLHTLSKVLRNPTVYEKLSAADGDEITAEFCATLPRIVANSPELRGKVALVYYDNTDPEENLAEVLLAKIREIEPNYESITRREE